MLFLELIQVLNTVQVYVFKVNLTLDILLMPHRFVGEQHHEDQYWVKYWPLQGKAAERFIIKL